MQPIIPTDKYDILAALEGQLIQILDSQWHKVEQGCIYTRYGVANLLWYEIGQLEVMLKNSRKEEAQNG